jgi:hypothetical protein
MQSRLDKEKSRSPFVMQDCRPRAVGKREAVKIEVSARQ